ncbi:metallopeptidase MepB [Phakopsora pachyrhizi]|uniref:Metallopeptidase MepB n=1 Tax=Phakopsora pachyrhizi TaxID=170000 RepID=A0AAV0BCW0_PHAPC|nr:metallopeptidase MepB [Phakopsora pachyrhizi]CAH7684097.1 metallopeptidase MepB [Phakopsora pachyrhizi]
MEGIKKISAPQPPPRWDHSAQKILALTNDAIKSSRIKLDQIASLKPEDCNFDSVVAPLAENDVIISDIECLTFYQYVSTREDVRNAAVEADKLIQAYDLELTSRLDIYKSILSAKSNIDQSKLDPESKRLIEKLILERKRNGLDLSEGDRKEYNTLKSEINNLAIDFQKNLNEEKGKIWFSLEELRGVPEDVISGFERKEEDQKYGMSFKTPDYSPVIQFAINPETRKRALLGYDSRSIENVPILNKILNLRKRAASVLKKSNWAGHTLEVKMAKEPKTVIQFLRKLREKLEPIGKEEKKKLIELKKNEYKKLGLQGDPEKFYIWDYRYYDRLYTESKLDLSSELVKEYFPVKKVVEAILDIYQELLSVKFIRLLNNKQEAGGEGGVWFKDVIGFEVWNREEYNQNIVKEDNLNSQPAKGFLGYLYLDLEPRDNKYGHAAVWGLIPGYMKADGTRNYPVAAMVANLAKETSTKPALLTHDNVVTFFHEMGHAFHQLCSETRYARFHGTNVARDFVEAPSQMLENWCWTKEQLLKISSHYKNNHEKLPLELIDKLIKSRDVNSGLSNLRQIFFGLFDMYVHTDWKEEEEDNLTKVWCKMRDEVNLFDPSSDLSPGQSTFGHIVGGYDAGYYGYLYSQVFSADMFKTKFEADPMSKSIGKLYREEILRPGGSRDELESLKKFLGREPNDEAFLKRLLGSSNP